MATTSVPAFLQFLTLALMLAIAVGTDLQAQRIPNRLVGIGIALALVTHLIFLNSGYESAPGDNWWAPIAGLLAGFALLMPLYLLRAMGAGDVKLMAMVGAFIGVPAILAATLYTMVAGGLLAILFMMARGVAAQTINNLRVMLTCWAFRAGTGQGLQLDAPLQSTAARLPYALAIALGTGAAILLPIQWS